MSDKTHERVDLKYVSVDDCEPNSWNAQGMSTQMFERLKAEISENGFIVPMQVVPIENNRYRIIGGEHRWQVAKELGLTEVPVAVLSEKRWKDGDLQKFVTVRLNVLGGKLDPEKFAKLYTEMAEKYGADALQNLMGFCDSKEFAKALGGMKKALKKALPPEMHARVDEAAKEGKSVADLGNIIQMLFSQYGDTVQQSFMIFTYGKQEHLYVQMDKKLKKLVDKVIEYTRATGEDINAVFLSVLEPTVKDLSKRLDAKRADDPDNSDGDEAGF
jgi:hypothetical protein